MVNVRVVGIEGCESTARLVILRSEGDGIACYAKGIAENYRSRDSLDYILRLSTKQRAVSMVQRSKWFHRCLGRRTDWVFEGNWGRANKAVGDSHLLTC